jgi:hypothetical protein
MAEIKENLRYLQVTLRYLRNTVAELQNSRTPETIITLS